MLHNPTSGGSYISASLSSEGWAAPPFSVLMSVYHREQPLFLRQALDSVVSQTLMPTEIVMVWDGPLTSELEAVLEEFSQLHPGLFHFVKLPENVGLGKALNTGLAACHYDIVVRMDTDDISLPHRFEQQVRMLDQHPELDAISSAINEFSDTPEVVTSVRRPPESHEDLVAFAKRFSPLNHPATTFRKSSILRAGGYMHMPFLEDYYLWVRLIVHGGRLYSFPESLLAMRMNLKTVARRRGWRYAKSEMQLQRQFRKMGFISRGEYVRNICLRVPPRLMPAWLLAAIYRYYLRRKR